MEGTNGGFRKVIDSSEKRVVQTNQFGGDCYCARVFRGH